MITFEFNQQLMPQSLIDVENIGDFAIEASNDEGVFWYLIVKTSLGVTTMASCGPVVPDVNLLPSGYCTYLSRIDYKEDKLIKQINMWLNDRSKKLTSASIVDIEDALDQFRDVGEYMRNYSEDQN